MRVCGQADFELLTEESITKYVLYPVMCHEMVIFVDKNIKFFGHFG